MLDPEIYEFEAPVWKGLKPLVAAPAVEAAEATTHQAALAAATVKTPEEPQPE